MPCGLAQCWFGIRLATRSKEGALFYVDIYVGKNIKGKRERGIPDLIIHF